MRDSRCLVPTIRVCALASFLLIPLVGWAQNAPTGLRTSAGKFVKLDPRATVSRRLLRGPDNGVGLLSHTLSINGDQFDPLTSDTGYSNQFVNGSFVRYPTSATPGNQDAFFHASFDLPSGAVIDAVAMEVWANSPTAVIGFFLDVCDGTIPLNGCNDVGASATAGNAGPVYISVSGLNETIDNLNKSYLIEVNAGDDFTGNIGFRRAVVTYHLQVSPTPGSPTFGDVPPSDPGFQYIEALVASGITAGCGGGNYCPDASLTRRQMAVFLSKALGLYWPN